MVPATDAQAGELLIRYLADRDVSCPACGYNLRDLTRARCPECDQELALRVGLVESGLAGFIAGLIGLAAGAGFSGLLLLFFTIHIFLGHFTPGWFLWFTGAGVLLEGGLLALWVACGRRIRRLGRGSRLLLVLGCWVLTLVNLIVFTATIR